jgi:putative endonuclease
VRGFCVYILRCSDGSLYTGITRDLRERLARHNEGHASKYTRSRLPVSVTYIEEARNLRAALRREFEIKKLSRREKLLLCASYSAKQRQSFR